MKNGIFKGFKECYWYQVSFKGFKVFIVDYKSYVSSSFNMYVFVVKLQSIQNEDHNSNKKNKTVPPSCTTP